MVNEISAKINEIIWSTNTESDHLDNLLYFIQYQTGKLFEHSTIVFESSLPDVIPGVIFNAQSRRNSYLVVKEIVHNAIKHSNASMISLTVVVKNGFLIFLIKDNGIGFDPNCLEINSMGLINVRFRIEKLKGSLVIEDYKGTTIIIKIPLKDNVIING